MEDRPAFVRHGAGNGARHVNGTKPGADSVHQVVVGVAPFEVGHMIVERISVEVVHLREFFRVGDKRFRYQSVHIARGMNPFLINVYSLITIVEETAAQYLFLRFLQAHDPPVVRHHIIIVFFDKSPVFHT